jgi:hypothetical protein
MLMSDCVDLGPQLIAGLIDDRVRKSIEVIHAQPVIAVRPPPLVLNQQISNALKLSKKGLGYGSAYMLGVVICRIAKLCLRLGMNPVVHARRARTLASASSPGTMTTLPDLTSSRRFLARSNQAAWATDLGSKLTINRSTNLALSSGGNWSARATKSSTGVIMLPLQLSWKDATT